MRIDAARAKAQLCGGRNDQASFLGIMHFRALWMPWVRRGLARSLTHVVSVASATGHRRMLHGVWNPTCGKVQVLFGVSLLMGASPVVNLLGMATGTPCTR